MKGPITTFFQVEVDLSHVPFKLFQEFVDFLKVVYDFVTAPIMGMKVKIQIVHQGRRTDVGVRVASSLYHIPYRLVSE